MPYSQSSPNQLKSVEPEWAFQPRAMCHKTQKQTEWWKCALIAMCQYYKHHWKTVFNLINDIALINRAGTNSSNYKMILSVYRSKSHSFQNPKKTGFPGFLLSATRNPGFKILPRIGNTSGEPAARVNIWYGPHQKFRYQSWDTTTRQNKTPWQTGTQTVSQEKSHSLLGIEIVFFR